MAFSTSSAAPLGNGRSDSAAGGKPAFRFAQGQSTSNPQPHGAVYVPPRSYSGEQEAIIHSRSQIVVGQAFAGTGKSTTGIGYAAHHPKERILALSFNTENAAQSLEKYRKVGTNTDVVTAHALAFRSLPERMRSRVVHRWNSITLRSQLPMVGARGDGRTAAIVASILQAYFVSADAEIDPYKHGRRARNELHANDTTIGQCSVYAYRVWEAMQSETPIVGMSTSTNTISIPHDAYLKMFVNRAGNLGYDMVILDEWQDANPVMLQLMAKQYESGSRSIFLGDLHQSIYEFRGAANAMENLPAGAEILPLTQSWRFGPETAKVANFILQELKGETLDIVGMGEDKPYVEGAPMAYLSRTNADLLSRAAAAQGKGCYWVGGIANYRVGILNDVWALKEGRVNDIQDFYIKKHFSHWGEFHDASEFDHETKTLCRLIEEYGPAIPSLVEALTVNAQRVVNKLDPVTMNLATAHKSKGLEFDYVTIADDYRQVFWEAEAWLSGKDKPFPEQEVNLMYVISTRAKKLLVPNRAMNEWFDNINTSRRKRVRSWGDPQERAASRTANASGESGAASETKSNSAFAKIQRPTLARRA